MRKGVQRHVLSLTVYLAGGAVHAATGAGARIDEAARVGVRSKPFIKNDIGALYGGRKAATPAAICDSPAPRRMLLRDRDAETLQTALDEGPRNNLPAPRSPRPCCAYGWATHRPTLA